MDKDVIGTLPAPVVKENETADGTAFYEKGTVRVFRQKIYS
jgi:hypothetical protein